MQHCMLPFHSISQLQFYTYRMSSINVEILHWTVNSVKAGNVPVFTQHPVPSQVPGNWQVLKNYL